MWVEFVVDAHLALRLFLRVLRFSSLHNKQTCTDKTKKNVKIGSSQYPMSVLRIEPLGFQTTAVGYS